jgi:hypothetical protein
MAERAGRWHSLGATSLLVLAVLVVAVIAAYKSELRLDWSYAGRFSLHPELHTVLQAQSEPVHLVGIWPQTSGGLIADIANSLKLMADTNPVIDYQSLDPELDRPELVALEPVLGMTLPFSIYLIRGDRAQRIPLGRDTPYLLQRDIGAALLALARSDAPPVIFLQGHGELDPTASGSDGCQNWAQALRLAGFQVAPWDERKLARHGSFPADAVVVIAGATADLGQASLAAFRLHLRDGGAGLVLADHRCPDDLAQLLRWRGLLVAGGIPSGLGQDPTRLFQDQVASDPVLQVHSATAALVGQRQRFDRLLLEKRHISPDEPSGRSAASGRSVLSPQSTRIIPVLPQEWLPRLPNLAQRFQTHGTPAFQPRILLKIASTEAWLVAPGAWRPPDPDQSRARPYVLAAAMDYVPHPDSVRPDRGARLLLWGSRDAAANPVLEQRTFSNELLLLDSISWLSRRQASDRIPPADIQTLRVNASDEVMWWILAMLVVVCPCLCLGGAMLAWWERR